MAAVGTESATFAPQNKEKVSFLYLFKHFSYLLYCFSRFFYNFANIKQKKVRQPIDISFILTTSIKD